MRADTAKMCFCLVAVVTKHLESVFRIVMRFQPRINVRTAKPLVFAVCRPVVVDMVNTQKPPIVNSAASAFSSIGRKDFSPTLITKPLVNRPGFVWIFFTPCFAVASQPLSDGIIMFEVIRSVPGFFPSHSFRRSEFFTHGLFPFLVIILRQ